MNHMRTVRKVRGLLQHAVLAAVIIVALLTGRHAAAQGTSGTLPDPISTRELTDYGKRLRLSDQQRQAAEKIHDKYKQDFRVLREGEIAAFMKDMRSMQGGGMPKRDAMESFMKKMDQLNDKINALDNRLFDELLPVLTEPQLAELPRIRQARVRARFVNQQMMWAFGNRAPDLSDIFREIELAPDQFQIADPMMAQYESRLTSDLTKLYECTTKMFLTMFDELEKQGITQATFENPESSQKAMEAMQAIWREITRKSMEIAGDIAELNHRTFKSVSASLSTEPSRQFREKYYAAAYPEAGFGAGGEAEFTEALRMKELSDSQREAVTVIRDELRRTIDHLMDEAVALIDAFRKKQSPFDYNAESWQDHQNKLNELQAKAATAHTSATNALAAALGPDLTEKLKAKTPQATEAPLEVLAQGMAVSGGSVAIQVSEASAAGSDQDVNEWSGDQFLPARINERELAEYASRLHLDEGQKTTMQAMHKDYLEKFKPVTDTEIAAVGKATQNLWKYDEATQTSTGPTAQQIDDVYRLRRVALEAIQRVDAAFFDDVEAAVLEPAQAPLMKRVRLARDRAVFNHAAQAGTFYFRGGEAEAAIDLSRFARRQKLEDQVMAALDPDLAAYEETVTAAFKAAYESSIEMQRAQERWNADMMKAQQEGQGNAVAFAGKWQEAMGEATRKANQAHSDLNKLNHATLDKLVAALPSDEAYAFRNAYNKQAFPSIYTDAMCVDRQLAIAAKLEGLTEEQRRAIADLAAEYRPAYAGFCDQMVQASSGGEGMNPYAGYDAEAWKKIQEHQEAIAKLQYDRNELNERAINTLRSTLSAEQIAHLGGLPEPAKEASGMGRW